MSTMAIDNQTEGSLGPVRRAGLALGFGLGGFFDGILLHQILQWHHLLSGLQQTRQDIRFLILTDGLFHLSMYVVTGVGLWLAWRARHLLAAAGADRRMLAGALTGFGAWHVLDGVLSHWILGIHRVRMDVGNPLVWDLAWLFVFGLTPVALGWLAGRNGSGGAKTKIRSSVVLIWAATVAGPIAALPAPRQSIVLVLFKPGLSPAQAFDAVNAVDGRLVWSDAADQLWAIDLPAGRRAEELYRHGALLVGNSLLGAGCLNWIRT